MTCHFILLVLSHHTLRVCADWSRRHQQPCAITANRKFSSGKKNDAETILPEYPTRQQAATRTEHLKYQQPVACSIVRAMFPRPGAMRSVILNGTSIQGGIAGGRVRAAVEANARRKRKNNYCKKKAVYDAKGCLSQAAPVKCPITPPDGSIVTY